MLARISLSLSLSLCVCVFVCDSYGYLLCDVNRQMKKRIRKLEAREAARAAQDPFGLDSSHAPEYHAAQELDLWETEALLALSDVDIPVLPDQSLTERPRPPQPPALPPQNPRTATANSHRSIVRISGTARHAEVLERRKQMVRLAAGLPLAALSNSYQQHFRCAIERRADRRKHVLQSRASQDLVERELAREHLISELRSALVVDITLEEHRDSLRVWEEVVSNILHDCTVAEDVESDILLSLEAAEDAAEVSSLSNVKADALIRETVRELFANLDQDGNGRLDR
eukprot:COSAG02_NODE_3099_length_7378_cov_3.046984_2_plen_286_part_00